MIMLLSRIERICGHFLLALWIALTPPRLLASLWRGLCRLAGLWLTMVALVAMVAGMVTLGACGQKRDLFLPSTHKIPLAVGEEPRSTHAVMSEAEPDARPTRDDEISGPSQDPRPPDDFDLPPL